MSTENKLVQIAITLGSVRLDDKDQVACECRVNDGSDTFLNHTAAFLACVMQETAQASIRDAMRYAHQQMNKQPKDTH